MAEYARNVHYKVLPETANPAYLGGDPLPGSEAQATLRTEVDRMIDESDRRVHALLSGILDVVKVEVAANDLAFANARAESAVEVASEVPVVEAAGDMAVAASVEVAESQDAQIIEFPVTRVA